MQCTYSMTRKWAVKYRWCGRTPQHYRRQGVCNIQIFFFHSTNFLLFTTLWMYLYVQLLQCYIRVISGTAHAETKKHLFVWEAKGSRSWRWWWWWRSLLGGCSFLAKELEVKFYLVKFYLVQQCTSLNMCVSCDLCEVVLFFVILSVLCRLVGRPMHEICARYYGPDRLLLLLLSRKVQAQKPNISERNSGYWNIRKRKSFIIINKILS